ncbi:MAG: outer membrane beta-barrel protein [Bacteroidota bacterium]
MNMRVITTNKTKLAKIFAIFSLSFIFFGSQVQAQKFKFGPRIGVATSPLNGSDFNFDDFDISFQDGSAEYKAGVFARLQLLGLYVQPEFLFTTSSGNFLVSDLVNGGSEILREQYYNVEIPIMAGIKLGPFRAHGGPVYRINLDNNSDFLSINGFGRGFRESTVSLQAGVGLDIGRKMVLDINYGFNLSDNRDEISLFGQTHELTDQGAQLSASLGFSF